MATTTTKTTCPVCQEEIADEGFNVNVQGKSMQVCCDDCAQKVRENPAKYGSGASQR